MLLAVWGGALALDHACVRRQRLLAGGLLAIAALVMLGVAMPAAPVQAISRSGTFMPTAS